MHLRYHLLSLKGLLQFDPHWEYSHFPPQRWSSLWGQAKPAPWVWRDQSRPWQYFILLHAKTCKRYQMSSAGKKWSGKAVVTEKYTELTFSCFSYYPIWQIPPIWRCPYICKYYEPQVWQGRSKSFSITAHRRLAERPWAWVTIKSNACSLMTNSVSYSPVLESN